MNVCMYVGKQVRMTIAKRVSDFYVVLEAPLVPFHFFLHLTQKVQCFDTNVLDLCNLTSDLNSNPSPNTTT